MADDVDFASTLIDNELARAIDKIRQSSASQNVVGSKFCLECEDDMPEARQALGFKFCVACAEERERRQQMFAG
ncbi:MAG: TraR/DksA family transcriptional regulator [Gammaproteobacteria bacterium]